MLHGGLDVHKDFVQACFVNEDGRTVKEARYETTSKGLHDLCWQAIGSKCVIEASTACLPVYDALQAQNVQVRVAHPLKLKAIASAKLKTDKVDARMLAQLERANLIPEAHIPNKAVRELKQLVRQHVVLTNERTNIKNQVHALLLKNGVRTPFKNVFSCKAREWLERNAVGVFKLSLEQTMQRIDFLGEQREIVDVEIEKRAQANEDAVLLKTIPGVGWFSALLLAAEIDGVQRFQDAKHLQSYAGLTPSTRQSGSVTRTGSLSKQGNKLMRWALTQDAWVAIEHSKRFRKVFKRVARKRGVKKAIIAVARRIACCAFFMLSRRQAFDENA